MEATHQVVGNPRNIVMVLNCDNKDLPCILVAFNETLGQMCLSDAPNSCHSMCNSIGSSLWHRHGGGTEEELCARPNRPFVHDVL